MNKVKKSRWMACLEDSRGAAAVMVSIMMVVLLAAGAAAIDIGHALVARNELQNVSDAAALAGDRALAIIYEGMTPSAQQTYVLTGADQATIVAAAQATAVANSAAGVPITLNAADIAIGYWDFGTRTFTPGNAVPTAVRVIARRDTSANGPISTFLANIVGMSSMNVGAVGTANLGPINAVNPADMDAPFGISDYYFSSGFGCGDTIQFSPSNGTPQSCAGWTSYDQSPFNNNTLTSIVNQMASGNNPSPAAVAGQTSLVFGNGNLGNPAWTALQNLLQYHINTEGQWDALVPVYGPSGTTDCTPTGFKPIIGFATVRILYVGGPGDPNNALNCTGGNVSTGCINGVVQCNVFDGTAGGGIPFGPTFATIPGLVE
jgi:Flp pilus assembly protein TadG